MPTLKRTEKTGPRRLLAATFLCFLLMAHYGASFAFTGEEKNTIDVYQRVAPSVVNITAEVLQFDFFFRPVPTSGAGSGVILDAEGTIVTNYHVIAGARALGVTLSDGSHWEAEVVGTSPESDLAVIRIHAEDRTLAPIALGNSDELEVGRKVFAIGNPFGLGQTLTVGIVSQLNRDLRSDGGVFRGLIQTDAAVNPGNSGGALVDSAGKLVGINTAILSPTGSSVGIGFAIPINRVKHVVPGLTHAGGRWLGWLLAFLLVAWMIRRIIRAA